MAEKLSELLEQLSVKAKALENRFEASKTEKLEQLQQWENDLKQKISENKVEFEEKKAELDADVKEHWETVKANFESGISKAKSDFKEAKNKLDEYSADLKADWAEKEAEISVYIALDAIADAEQSIIEAAKARESANN